MPVGLLLAIPAAGPPPGGWHAEILFGGDATVAYHRPSPPEPDSRLRLGAAAGAAVGVPLSDGLVFDAAAAAHLFGGEESTPTCLDCYRLEHVLQLCGGAGLRLESLAFGTVVSVALRPSWVVQWRYFSGGLSGDGLRRFTHRPRLVAALAISLPAGGGPTFGVRLEPFLDFVGGGATLALALGWR
jgi:hypothetical protein